jgi:hypothetical protein
MIQKIQDAGPITLVSPNPRQLRKVQNSKSTKWVLGFARSEALVVLVARGTLTQVEVLQASSRTRKGFYG